jgi:hypothetical protein
VTPMPELRGADGVAGVTGEPPSTWSAVRHNVC